MKKIFVALLLVMSMVMCGFSRQYVRTYTYDNLTIGGFVKYVNEQISAELRSGSSVVSITPILDHCHGNGSYTIAVIVLYDDGVQ